MNTNGRGIRWNIHDKSLNLGTLRNEVEIAFKSLGPCWIWTHSWTQDPTGETFEAYCTQKWHLITFQTKFSSERTWRWHTTENNAGIFVQSCQHEVQNITSDIIEVDIQIPHGLLEVLQEGGTLVVKGFLYANLFLQTIALVLWTGNTIDLCPSCFTELTRNVTNGPSCTWNNKCFPWLNFSDPLESEVCCETGTAKYIEIIERLNAWIKSTSLWMKYWISEALLLTQAYWDTCLGQ